MCFFRQTRHTLTRLCCLHWALWAAPGAAVALGAQPLQLVYVSEGRVTLDAHDASLRALLEEIAREAGLELEGEEWLTGTITVRFRRRPLAQALPLILGDRGYALVSATPTSPEGTSPPRPSHLRLFRPTAPPGDPVEGHARDRVTGEDTLLEQLETGPDALDRLDAIDALAQSDDPATVRRMGLAALRDPDESVRAAAIEALALLGGDSAVEMLELALRDRAIEIREDAVTALQRIGGDRAARGLTAAVHDRSAEVRWLAVDALGDIGGPAATQLLEYVRAVDPDAELRTAADEWLTRLRR